MRITILFFLLLRSITASSQFSQQDSIPDIEILFSSIDSFYNQKLESEIKAFEADPKDYWMNFVPSIGMAYNLEGKPRPSFSFSLNSLFQVRAQKRQVAALRESIILKNQIERLETKNQVRKLKQRIEILKSDLEFSMQLFEIDNQLFEFYEKQNQNNDIKPSEFLIKKKDYLTKKQSIRLEEREIRISILDLLESSYYKF